MSDRVQRSSDRVSVDQIGCSVAQRRCSVAQTGCSVDRIGYGVAQIWSNVAQIGCNVAQLGGSIAPVVRLPAVRQARGSNLGTALQGGLCLFSGINEEFPAELVCIKVYVKNKGKRVALCREGFLFLPCNN
jgi:hypothetical protein